MTLKDFIRVSPGFLFFKKDKQWKGCDVDEFWRKSEYEELKEAAAAGQVLDRFGGGPVYVLVDKDSETRAADFYEGCDIRAFLYP